MRIRAVRLQRRERTDARRELKAFFAMKTTYLYKSLRPGLRSLNGHEFTWKIGEWKKKTTPLSMCNNGFHASKNVLDAMSYVHAAFIAKVEVRGDHLSQDDKQCWSEMRVVEAKEWTKEDSVALAIYAARLVLPIWEKRHPDDKRVRNAIETAERFARGDDGVTLENLGMARAAAAAAADAAAAAAACKSTLKQCADLVRPLLKVE